MRHSRKEAPYQRPIVAARGSGAETADDLETTSSGAQGLFGSGTWRIGALVRGRRCCSGRGSGSKRTKGEIDQHRRATASAPQSRRSDSEPGSIPGGRARSWDDRRHPRNRFPWRGWKDILWRVYAQMNDDRLLAVAGGVVFYALLALFPAITAFVSLYGLLGRCIDHRRTSLARSGHPAQRRGRHTTRTTGASDRKPNVGPELSGSSSDCCLRFGAPIQGRRRSSTA